WAALVLLDEADRPLRQLVGHVLVLPARRLAAAHVADAADAVDDRVVVTLARLHLQQVGVLGARGLVADRLTVADLDGVLRVVADDLVILDVDARRAVAGGGDDERVVEADVARAAR